MSAAKRVQQARTALVMDPGYAFFGALALRLKLQEDPGCGTMWTDGVTVGYDPAFVEASSHSELVGTVAHEATHVASGHPWRRSGRDMKRWNIACDISINPTIRDAGLQLPDGVLYPSDYGLPEGMGAEWYFDRLPADAGENGEPQPGEVRDAPTDPDPDGNPAPSEAEWKQAVQQAANVAKARGELSGGLERFAAANAAPAVDWRSVLQRFAQQAAKADYSWSRPNSRYAARGLYLPALRSTDMGRIAVAVDVSGSVDDVLLAQFSAEINAIVAELRPAAVDVLYCDSRVQRQEEYLPGDTVELKSCGGGGTSFRPVFEALDAAEEPPVCLVYLTDLYGSFPRQAPDYPVLWAATSGQVAPFGETVRVM